MKEYRTFKTSMGNKVRVRMTESEIAERELFHIVLIALPLLASAGMFLLWIKMGG